MKITFRKLGLMTALLILAVVSPALAQHIPIPNEPNGAGCITNPPVDPTQCSGYKTRGDWNARFGGAQPISPAYTAATLTASSAGVPAGVSTIILNPSGAQALTLYAATGSGFEVSFINRSAFTITITATGSTIGNLSSWSIFANQSLTVRDGFVTGWVVKSQNPGNLPFAASATTDTTNATNISSGTLSSARLPSVGATGSYTNANITVDAQGRVTSAINGSSGTGGSISINNAGSTGTATNSLVKLTGAPSTAVSTTTTDTAGVVGVCASGCGTSGTATINTAGSVNCAFDGATTASDYVQISSLTAGDCTDAGSSYPISGQVIGQVKTTNGSAGTYAVNLSLASASFNPHAPPAIGDVTPGAVTGAAGSFQSFNNNMLMADRYPGSGAAEKITSCLAAMPIRGATCDASGLTGAQTWDETVTVPANSVLLLGAATFTTTALPALKMSKNSRVSGLTGVNQLATSGTTTFQLSGTGAGSLIASNGTSAVYGITIEKLVLNGLSDSDSSIGIDLQNISQAFITHNVVANFQTGMREGGNGNGSYYNVSLQNWFGGNMLVGEDYQQNANHDQSIEDSIHAGGTPTSTSWQLDPGSISDDLTDPDCESGSGTVCIDFQSGGSAITGTFYCEGATTCIQFESGALNNLVWAAGSATSVAHTIVYASGADKISNVALWVNADQIVQWPIYWDATNYYVTVGSAPNYYTIRPDPSGSGTLWMEPAYTAGAAPEVNSGLTGHAAMSVGEILSFGGVEDFGSLSTSFISTPSGLTCTPTCLSGCTTTYEYKVVCRDFNTASQGFTLPSASVTCSNNATLGAGNSNLLAWNKEDGCFKWDIIGNQDFVHSVATNAAVPIPGSVATPGTVYNYTDTNNAPAPYTPPARPSTGDARIVGGIAVGQPTGGVVATGDVNALSFHVNNVLVTSAATGNASGLTSGTVPAAQLPNPSASTLGGVQSYAAVSHQWINAVSTSGVHSSTQPAASDITGLAASATTDTTNATNISSGTLGAARLPNPSASTLGGVESVTSASHQFVTSISTAGIPAQAQPAAADVSGLAASATTDTTNASNIASGTLGVPRMPTLSAYGAAATANNLSDLANRQTAAGNLGLQFYADNCPGIVNNGTSDDAAALRACMAAMPAGATMNLDGSANKPYFFNSSTITDPVWGSQPCDLVLKTPQSLNWNGARIAYGSTDPNGTTASICVGTPNFNYPGSSGGSPTFDTIGTTTGNTSSITLTTHANAANYHTGDDIYIDCGVPTNHVGVGWSQVAATGNASTGVLNLKYPLVKPYPGTNSVCVGQTPRIYDWTTCGGGSCGYNLGPLASNITIDGGGGSITSASNATNAPFTWEGSNNVTLANMTIHTDSFAMFANNNHLANISNVHVIGQGCSTDYVLYCGQFASAFCTMNNDSVNAVGTACTGQHVIPIGDSEGAESMTWNNPTVTIQAGAVGTSIAGVFEFESWNTKISGAIIQDDAANGYGIEEQSGTGTDGPKSYANNTVISPNQAAIASNTNGDVITGNILESNAQDVFLQGTGAQTVQGNQFLNGSNTVGTVEVNGAYGSTITGNTFSCPGASCGAAFNVINPGTTNTGALTIGPNSIPTGGSQYTGTGLTVAPSNLPNANFFTTANVAGNLSCTTCPIDVTRAANAANSGTACMVPVDGAIQAPYWTEISVQNWNSISCSSYPKFSIEDNSVAFSPQSSAVTMTSSNASYAKVAGGGVIAGSGPTDYYFFFLNTLGSGCTCTVGNGTGCLAYVTACMRVQ